MSMSEGWKEALEGVVQSEQYKALKRYVIERNSEVPVYPPPPLIFRALRECPLEDVKVVILGQDPYCGPGQATGLAFGVEGFDCPRPPTLRNILKELELDIGKPIDPTAKTLLGWARQGVLLLNSSLTVEEGRPDSHFGKGWEYVTDTILKTVCKEGEKRPIVALLWGNRARDKESLLNPNVYILKAGHPSPQSVKSFLGCRHFSKTNQWLISRGATPIDWSQIDLRGENG